MNQQFSNRLCVKAQGHLRIYRADIELARSQTSFESGGAMVARVTHYRIREGKVEEFATMVQSLTSAMDKLKGFRVLLILHGEDKSSREAMAISVWDSAEDLRDSDNNTFYYNVLARVLSCCESFSPMHQQEVMVSKFAES
jgi:heme-degrading monooxygenase HmoA